MDIDLDNCQHAIDVAKHRLQASDAPKYIKRLGAAIHPVVLIYHQKRSYLGGASVVGERCLSKEQRKFGIGASRYPTQRYQGRRYFMLIEIYTKTFTKWNKTRKYFLNRVMAHEFAHLIDALARHQIKGNWSVVDKNIDHDKFWSRINVACGGSKEDDGYIPMHAA